MLKVRRISFDTLNSALLRIPIPLLMKKRRSRLYAMALSSLVNKCLPSPQDFRFLNILNKFYVKYYVKLHVMNKLRTFFSDFGSQFNCGSRLSMLLFSISKRIIEGIYISEFLLNVYHQSEFVPEFFNSNFLYYVFRWPL